MRNYLISIVFLLALGLIPAISMAETAPAFKLPSAKGTVDLSSMRGKVVYVDFWASWCGPCRKSFPWMNDMYKKYKAQGLEIVAVNLDKERDPIDKFLEANPADFTIAYDPGGNVANKYQLKGMPTSYLIDRNGEIHDTHIGFREKDKDKLEEKISQALSGK